MKLIAVSDVYGEILEMAFSYSGKAIGFGHIQYKQIRKDFGAKVNYVAFLTPAQKLKSELESEDHLEIMLSKVWDDKETTRWYMEVKSQIDFNRVNRLVEKMEPGKNNISTTDWIQDAFMVMETPEKDVVLLQSVYHPRMADSSIALQLAEYHELNYLLKPTFFNLEGGNILVGDDFALVGRDTLAKNLLELHQQSPIEIADGEAAILRLFSKLLGMKHIIPIGRKVVKNDQNNYKGIFQPLYHIDLFMTLAGKYQGKNLLFMGSIELAQTILNQRFRKNMHFPFDTISSEINGIQKDLIQNTTTRSLDQPPQFIHELIPLLYWDNCFFSFNNVLVEVTEHGKKIYAPDYIDEESPENSEFNSIITIFKQECERIWKDYGFSTIWTGTGSYNLMWARKKGGLRCVTKVIKRGKYVP